MFEIEANANITVTRLEFLFASSYGDREYNLYMHDPGVSIDTTGFDVTRAKKWTQFEEGLATTDALNAVTPEFAVDIYAGNKRAFYIAALYSESILVTPRSNFGLLSGHANNDLVIKGGYTTPVGDPFGTGYESMRSSPTYITVYYKLT